MVDIRDFRSLEDYRQWLRMDCLLQKYPLSILRIRGLECIPRIRAIVKGQYNLQLMDEWETALHDTAEVLWSISLEISQHGIDMRANNPFIGIMSQEDNWRIIRESSNEQKSVLSSTSRI